ncbi:hypothetical protein NFX46_29690 [Streptomyces phaeoluteigriseus]|uniref:Secreted protein n=1 Tax=Streptomyces phaeoluteigriseus TaxID=114686 RepID=A0ABY4ZEP6_9ACTN|nr:hypothetical protein [Streptomyces phaeoluteigriseus]USQ87524.1 hypothetical protein NFX46_29690 [Streptomyces phaeoluteigriseus]
MRLFRSVAPVTVAVCLLLSLPYDALPHARAAAGSAAVPEEPSAAECRTSVVGSRVTAYCHNPHAATDRVRLHIECARWWDLDTDSAPADVGPAVTVLLTGRCWKEVGTAWVSHQRV